MAWGKKPSLSLIQLDTNEDVFQAGGMYSPYSRCSHSPQSRRSSDASSFVSGGDDVLGRAAEVVDSDDQFGLRGLFYFPAIESEVRRLFFPSGPAVAENNQQMLQSVWDEFDKNGVKVKLDDLDCLLRGMPARELESPPVDPETEETVQDILTKANLIDILRERELLQRSNRALTRMSAGNGSAATNNKFKVPSTRTCVFCRNNGEAEATYTSHHLKDPEGNVTCPILYIYTCPICGACGKNAHTIKYCPYTAGDAPSSGVKSSGGGKSATGRAIGKQSFY